MRSHMMSVLYAVVPVSATILVACAEGADVDLSEESLLSAPLDVDAGKEEGESIKMPPPSNPSDDDDEEDKDGPDGGKGDAGPVASPVDNNPACEAPTTCAKSTDLGSVSGDTGADVLTASGHTSAWFRVRVTEDHNDVIARQLWMTATLESPAGSNFDLYVYVPDADDGTLACSKAAFKSTSSTGIDKTTAKFGESGLVANGGSDSRTVTVEVRHVSGACDPDKKWKLKLVGNE